jgi:hypothetical protein
MTARPRSCTGLPVLFVHSSTREQHLHRRLSVVPRVLVATAARDRTHWTGAGPAEAVWLLHGGDSGRRVRLVDLPCDNVPR